jgi:hypothetical protein
MEAQVPFEEIRMNLMFFMYSSRNYDVSIFGYLSSPMSGTGELGSVPPPAVFLLDTTVEPIHRSKYQYSGP